MIRKAVFPVAGMGTRFLPATKAMPKELLPIIDKPIIQYAVEEAISAGMTDLIFITGRTKRSIEDHFDSNPDLEKELLEKGKDDLADAIRNIIPEGVNCIFVRQPKALGLGHAILCAEPVVGHEPFAVLLADDVISCENGHSVMLDLVKAYEENRCSQLLAMEVADEDTGKYGMIKQGRRGGPTDVAGLVEKPKPGEAPSNLASIGRYILEPRVFDLLRNQAPGAGNEIQLADAIDRMALDGLVRSVTLNGKRFDCGSKFGYLEAIVDFALAHEVFGPDFEKLISQKLASK